jgi:eukaryotic-like serine/threonine-protein kinase
MIEFGLLSGVCGGGIAGALAGRPSVHPRSVVVVELLRWSHQKARHQMLVSGVSVAVVGGMFGFLTFFLLPGGSVIRLMLISAILFGIVGGLFGGIVGGLDNHEVTTRTRPNEGIRRSATSALLVGLRGGLIFGLPFALVIGASEGLTFGLLFGIPVGLAYGGYACLSHIALRLVLWRNGCIPWNYARFLDYCADRIFLRKVGGGYIFVHRMLMEYFASLDTSQPAKADTEKDAPINQAGA